MMHSRAALKPAMEKSSHRDALRQLDDEKIEQDAAAKAGKKTFLEGLKEDMDGLELEQFFDECRKMKMANIMERKEEEKERAEAKRRKKLKMQKKLGINPAQITQKQTAVNVEEKVTKTPAKKL